MRNSFFVAVTAFILILSSCSAQPEPFKYGQDICYTCKMGIVDPKFGCQLITTKGKIFKFDDVVCLSRFIKSGTVTEKDIRQTVVINFEKENDFLDINKTFFVIDPAIKSPMGSHAAAFSGKEAAEKFNAGKTSQILNWKDLSGKLE